MSAKSLSHCQGKGSITHNNRDFTFKNVDPGRTKDNVTYVRQHLTEAYEHCFGDAVKRFNERQTRTDRRIQTSYYEDLFGKAPMSRVATSANKQKSFYETLVQVGTMDDTGVGTADGELAAKCLDEYMRGFAGRNPNFHVFNAVLHMDEATPHLHIDYIPVGHYSRGLDTQNGIAQALKEMGHGTGINAINRWRLSERQVLEDICGKYGIEIAETGKTRGYSLVPDEYKAQKDIEKAGIQSEVDELEDLRLETMSDISNLRYTVVELQSEVDDLQSQKKRVEDALEGVESKLEEQNKLIEQAKVLGHKLGVELREAKTELEHVRTVTKKEMASTAGKLAGGLEKMKILIAKERLEREKEAKFNAMESIFSHPKLKPILDEVMKEQKIKVKSRNNDERD